MKLKLQKNLMEFKLSQEEKLELNISGQSLVEKIILPDNKGIIYSIVLISDEKEKFDFSHNKVILSIPWKKFKELEIPGKKGISFEFDSLIVTVVVDLFPRKKNDN
ncbi:MAG: hypothetical protein ACJA0H_001247 [Francisellaceae bacterium]|jgi:hypothetical protein